MYLCGVKRYMMCPVDRTHAPEIHDFTQFKPEEPETCVLGNGITLKQFFNPQLDLLHFSIKIKAGTLFENKKNVAVFCYLLLKESSKLHSSNEVDEFLDYYGVNYTASIALEYVTINLIIPKQNCPTVLPYVFDFLIHPTFKVQNIEILRKRKLMDLAYNREKVSYCASQLMLHHFFGDSCTVGKQLDEHDLESITAEDLHQYHQKSFCAENIRLFAAGNLNEETCQLLAQLFETIPHGQPSIAPTLPSHRMEATAPIVDQHEGCMQSALYLYQPSIGYNHPRRMDFSVLATILGGYFGSRLMGNLRETNGYTYGVSCDSLYFADTSLFYIESEVNVNTTIQAIDECYNEIEKLSQEPVQPEELQLVKHYMAGQLIRKVDNTVSYMTQYSRWDDYGCEKGEFERQMHNIMAFDSEKNVKLAQAWLQRKNFTTIVAGALEPVHR